jgi:hypothetical protein
MREELAEKIGLTLDDDGGLKQKKLIVCLMTISSHRSISDLRTRFALTGSFSGATHTITTTIIILA